MEKDMFIERKPVRWADDRADKVLAIILAFLVGTLFGFHALAFVMIDRMH